MFTRCKRQEKIILALFVDDGLVAATSDKKAKQFIDELKSEFKITVKKASYFLGFEIDQGRDGSIKISQASYSRKLIAQFGMSECRSSSTPAISESGKVVLVNKDAENKIDSDEPFSYRSAVGVLMYLSVILRPDVSYALSVASRTLEKPSTEDFVRVKRIFRYLQGTIDRGLVYKPDYMEGVIECYNDADHGGDQSTARSTTGVVCLHAGGAISWLSQRQSSVAISTTEAEIVAASERACETVWLKRLLSEMISLKKKPELLVDNESAVKLAQNPEFHKRTKHIRIRHFYVRELMAEGQINVERV